ncbi:MAG: GNAT family N-acetyltransferase [Microbacterium arborescens]
MEHVDLRALDDADLDVMTGVPADAAAREDLLAWIDRARSRDDASLRAITRDGDPVGFAATFTVDGDRTVALRLGPSAQAADMTAALRLLAAGEAERPLYARADHGDGMAEVFRAGGFSDLTPQQESPADAEVVLVLPPTLDGV